MEGASPETLQSMRASAARMRQMRLEALMRSGCSEEAARDELKQYDACQANLDALTAQATAEAAQRRAVVGPAVAALRADERYAPALGTLDHARAHENGECAQADAAEMAGVLPPGSHVHGRCDDARGERMDAEAAVRALFTEHHIDVRDAQALGLW
jgi:hypothetical protein